jgi:hypothetical protein
MRLILHYRGQLKAAGSPSHKHDIRRVFHQQLSTLWRQKPLSESKSLLRPKERNGDYCLLRPLAPFTFVPLASEEMNVVVSLEVTLLRPEPPGNLITQGGDMDNRLKTLFDALTMPRHFNALPSGLKPDPDESLFFCLLEDDNLITNLTVRTEQLLEPGVAPNTVVATIHIRTHVTRTTMGNFDFA